MTPSRLDPGRNELRGRLEHFRDVLIRDATFISLFDDQWMSTPSATMLPARNSISLNRSLQAFQRNGERQTVRLTKASRCPPAGGYLERSFSSIAYCMFKIKWCKMYL